MRVVEPAYEVTISLELGRLVSLGGRLEPAERALVSEVARAIKTLQTKKSPSSRDAVSSHWPEVILRCDGARPVRFRGLNVYTARSCGEFREEGCGTLSLFATRDGHAIAQLVYVPPGNMPARPVYRVACIPDATHLRRFLMLNGPRDCFAVNEDGMRHEVARSACEAMKIPAALDGIALPPDPT